MMYNQNTPQEPRRPVDVVTSPASENASSSNFYEIEDPYEPGKRERGEEIDQNSDDLVAS